MRWSNLLRRVGLSLLCIYTGLWGVFAWRATQLDLAWPAVQAVGVLRVGMDASFPPFSDVTDGHIAGLDVDIANEIARRLGVTTQIVNVGYDGLYDALLTRRVDVLISALSFDPARFGTFIYTRPYIDAGQVIVTRDTAYVEMTSLEGKTVAVEYGSVGDEITRIWERRLHRLIVRRLSSTTEALTALNENQVDAAIVDMVSARLFRREHPALVIAPQTVAPDTYAVAVQRKSMDLAGKVQAALNAMEADGTLARIIGRWL